MCEKGNFVTLSHTLLHLVLKIFKKKNFTLIKMTRLNTLRFFANESTHFFKISNFDSKVFKLHCYNSVTQHVSPKNPISGKKLRITSTKIQSSPKFFFLSDFVINQLNLYVIKSFSWKIRSIWCFQRNVGSACERAQTSQHCCISLVSY